MPDRAIYIGTNQHRRGHFATLYPLTDAERAAPNVPSLEDYRAFRTVFDVEPDNSVYGYSYDDFQVIAQAATNGTVWVIWRRSDIEPVRIIATRKCPIQAHMFIEARIRMEEDTLGWPEEPQELSNPESEHEEWIQENTWINERNLVVYGMTQMRVGDAQFELPVPTVDELDIPAVNLHEPVAGLSISPSTTGSGYRIRWGEPVPAEPTRRRRVR